MIIGKNLGWSQRNLFKKSPNLRQRKKEINIRYFLISKVFNSVWQMEIERKFEKLIEDSVDLIEDKQKGSVRAGAAKRVCGMFQIEEYYSLLGTKQTIETQKLKQFIKSEFVHKKCQNFTIFVERQRKKDEEKKLLVILGLLDSERELESKYFTRESLKNLNANLRTI
jgi:hypothetical protein